MSTRRRLGFGVTARLPVDRVQRSSRSWASRPATIGAANDVPDQLPKPPEKSSGSMLSRTVPSGYCVRAVGWSEALKVIGRVLTTAAPAS